MKKLNMFGKDILEYKSELLKDYSKLVERSLLDAAQKKLELTPDGMSVFEALKDSNVEIEDFKTILLNNSNFSKSEAEIRKELEELGKEKIKVLEDYGVFDVEADVDVNTDEVFIYKEIAFTSDYFREYFDIPDDALIALMKPKSIGERIARLRLSKFKKVIEEEMEDEVKGGVLTNSEFLSKKDKYYMKTGISYKSEFLNKDTDTFTAEYKNFCDFLIPYIKREMVL